MKRILAVLLALAMLLGFAACGGNNEDTTTTTAEDTTIAEEVTEDADAEEETTAADVTQETTVAEEETTVAEEATTFVDESTTAVEGTTAATTAAPVVATGDMTKAEFVKFLNAETAKIAKSGNYGLLRKCYYTRSIDVGGFTDILNGVIQKVDANADLDSVVAGFIGIGETKGNVPKDSIDPNYKVKASTLTEADLGNFKANNGTYTFTLANAKDPKKTGTTPFSRFTDNFFTEEEVAARIAKELADVGNLITVAGSEVDYTNIKVEVKVADGKITSIKYGYSMDATLILKVAIAKITGTGAGNMETIYSNIKY